MGLASGVRFDYSEHVLAAQAALLKKYKRIRSVEVAVSDRLQLSDAALNFAARSIGFRERGEGLYAHKDASVLIELATYHHRLRSKTVIERFFEKAKPAVGTDEHLVLTAMMNSPVTLLLLGEAVPGIGVHVEDLLFGGNLFLADIPLSKRKKKDEKVIVTRRLVFDDFVMTPCTSYLDFDPELARMMAKGLHNESALPMAERYTSVEAKAELATDMMEMALCSIESVRESLVERFAVSGV